MFNYIKGTITSINGNFITIENGSIGYMIKTPNPFNFELKSKTIIYTYLHVREELLELYGFKTEAERNFFIQLISVKGLGPKGALAILAYDDLEAIMNAINNGNARFLQKFPGIGVKASQQIILDLHGKINFNSNSQLNTPKINNVKDALRSLGYTSLEIKRVLPVLESQIELEDKELIKLALKSLNSMKNN